MEKLKIFRQLNRSLFTQTAHNKHSLPYKNQDGTSLKHSFSKSHTQHKYSTGGRLRMAAYMSMGEAHRRITEYLNRFSDVVSYQDGTSLKHLLSLSSESPNFLALADALNLFQVSI